MIKLFGRMGPVALRSLGRPLRDPLAPLATPFRVLPHDIDLNLHLNNGRYHQLIDVNRMEWVWRTGILRAALQRRWKPILGSSAIQFRHELRLWDAGLCRTELLGWDERWFYLEHRVETRQGKLVALALARAAFRTNGTWVTTERMREAIGAAHVRMALPAHVLAWRQLDESFGRLIKAQPPGLDEHPLDLAGDLTQIA